MESREKAPNRADPTDLPGGGKLGCFWSECKCRKRCENFPYERLLTNSVLRADYRYSPSGTNVGALLTGSE